MNTPRHILCIEDYPDTRLMLTLLFRQAGYDITTADSVEEAWELSKTVDFDLYLLDHIVGQDSGLNLCRQIREADTETPICFYSGMDGVQHKKMATDAGANAYITKPADVPVLLSAISRLLEENTEA